MAEQATQDVNEPVVTQDATPAEPSAAENNTPAATDEGLDDLWGEETADAASDTPKPKDPEKTEPKPQSEGDPNAEQPNGDKPEDAAQDGEPADDDEASQDQSHGKQDANSRIRGLNAEKNYYKANLQRAIEQGYQPATAEQLMEQGMSESDAKFAALESQVKLGDFSRQVAELNTTVESEAAQVLQDFPIFDPDSKDFNPQLSERVSELYEQAAGAQVDPRTNLLVGINVTPYHFFKTFAEMYQMASAKAQADGQVKGQQAADEQMARVDPTPSAPRKPAKKSELDELWES